MLFGEPRTPLLLLAADEPHGVLPHIQLFSSLNGIMYAVDINPSGASVSLAVQEEEKHKMSMLGGWGGVDRGALQATALTCYVNTLFN